MRRVALGLTACTCALVTYAQEPVSLAILREDGYLVPVVSIVGDQYIPLTAFPDSENKSVFTPEAVALDDSSWMLWRRGATKAEPIRVLNRAMVHNHCTDEEAWRTTVQGKQVEKHVADIRKLGVAIRGGELRRPENVTTQPDESSRRVARRVVALTHAGGDRLEPEIRRLFTNTNSSGVVRLEKLLRHRNNVSTYYFEAVKNFGDVGAVTTGWIVEANEGLRTHDIKSGISDGESGLVRGDILAIVTRGPVTAWLGVLHAYEGEGYGIHEWPSGRFIDNLGGGGC